MTLCDSNTAPPSTPLSLGQARAARYTRQTQDRERGAGRACNLDGSQGSVLLRGRLLRLAAEHKVDKALGLGLDPRALAPALLLLEADLLLEGTRLGLVGQLAEQHALRALEPAPDRLPDHRVRD
eukprot:3186389-Rhodomonas_salina.2